MLPLVEFTAVTVTPGRTLPAVSRTDPVSVELVTATFGRVESSIVSTGATPVAVGIAGRAASTASRAAGAAGASVGADSTFGIGAVDSVAGDAVVGGAVAGGADAISPSRAAGRCGSGES